MQELLATFYLLIICLAFWGYGANILRWGSPMHQPDTGISLAVGLGIFIAWSGNLELLHMASPLSFKIFLALGLLLALAKLSKPIKLIAISNWHGKLESFWVVLGALLCMAFIFITVWYFYRLPLNQHDDFSGYLVLAKRILQEGFQGGDPFNDRSIEQGFGAGNYLIALMSSFLPINAAHLADAGIGLVLLILLSIDAFRKSTGTHTFWLMFACIIIWCAVVINAPIVNTSPLIIAGGLFISIITLYIRSNYGARYFDHVLLALLLSSLLVLKGNYIIPVCATIMCIYLSRLSITKLHRAILEMGIFSISMLLFTLPWMVANWQFSNTAFYPLLGHGLVSPNAMVMADFDQFVDSITTLIPFYIILLALLGVIYRFKVDLDRRLVFFITSLVVSLILLSCALTMTSAGSLVRYSYVSLFGPSGFLALYILFTLSPKELMRGDRRNVINAIVLIVLFCFSLPQLLDTLKRSSRSLVKAISLPTTGITSLLDFPKEQLRVSLLQSSLPPKSTVLLRLDTPFLIDFTQQKFHVMDWPGNVGPKPGVPYDKPPEILAQYLRENGIQYIAYSYANEAFFPSSDEELVSRKNHLNPWIRTQATRTFEVQKQLQALGGQYPRIYDNGQDFVINLSGKISP